MNDLLGESLLAIIGIKPFLEQDHPRVTKALHAQALRLPQVMRAEVRAYLNDEKLDGRRSKQREAFPYLRVLEQLSRPVQPQDLEALIDAHQEPTDALDMLIPLVRGLAFLNGSAPRRSKQTLTGAEPLTPSDQDVERFRRKFTVVNGPLSLMGKLRSAGILADEVAAFAGVYPALYEQLVTAVNEELGAWKERNGKSDLPYRKERQLSLLLQLSGTDAGLVQDLQATFGDQPVEGEAGGPPKGGSNIDLKPKSFQTGGQASEGGGR